MATSDNKRIAKNTLALYFRMGLSMVVGLFTSRVILQVLGVTDMGINATVGGVVTFAGFLNAALSNGTSRFLTVALGKDDIQHMKLTFSTCFWVHLALALIIALLMESIGLWFLYNKLVIPDDRLDAAIWVFHLGVISMVVNMTQVPYTSSIIAHERMDMYAYTSLADTFLKLAIVYVLTIFDVDKLKLYSSLFFLTHMGILLFYRWFCESRFKECRINRKFDKSILKPVLSFSGWQLIAGVSGTLASQGILILLNMFFSPAIVAARSISLQVNNYASQFMTNFRTAANPQIIKLYSAGNLEESKHLLLESTKFAYFMMLLMTLPVFLLSYQILYVWLGQVPEYCDVFLKLVMIQGLFQVFDTGLYTAIYANGNIKWNALTSPTLELLCFPIVYYLFKNGSSPIALSWVFIVLFAVLGCIQKPVLLIKICNYNLTDFRYLFGNCIKVTLISCLIPFSSVSFLRCNIDDQIIFSIIVCVISIISVLITVWFCGIETQMRHKLIQIFKRKLFNRQ